MAASAASTSANPNSANNSSYDVFLNHRGPDVKKTFASHLYRRLLLSGLKVFQDHEEMQQGYYLNPQIEGAIQTASVHVAIFSPRYAESPWCLNELLLMLESKGIIIPVFYHVKPTELRWTQGGDGLYAQALRTLEKKRNYDPQTEQETPRHDSATLEHWRKALYDVSQISGFELEACNGDEGALVEKVVENVLRKVKKTPLNVAKYPTGLDEKLRDFEDKILGNHKKSQVVGIVGSGGVGKTTLAKKLFNWKSSHYSKSCFLDDVRENVSKGSLISLQSKLLKSLTGSDPQIDNKDEGIEKLKKHLSSSKILLVLDDVDNVEQVDALVPDKTSIHSNSLILITSRDRDVLRSSAIKKWSIYKLNGLNEQHSMELFCYHAFGQSCPLPSFENLAKKFVNACHGLPLSLKVFGALLCGNNGMSYWDKQLHKLQKILPKDIEERLRISYDAQDLEQKQIFLDVACFFIGDDRDKAITIWNGSEWDGWLGFQNLQDKSLVEVDDSNMIRMHDHLRDLGRFEARVLEPFRFLHINELLQQSSVITVRGIRMVLGEYHDDDEFDDIRMRRLQLVDTEGSLLERLMKRIKSPNLIWLRWKDCPYSSLPLWIPMKNLRVLEVSHCTLETLWQHESQAPLCLEELQAWKCVKLKSMRGLEQATKLRLLNVNGCSELDELPSIEVLVSLEVLWARGCVKLKNIRGLGQPTKLRLLNISGCSKLDELPSMEALVSLEGLWAKGCVKLKSVRGLEQATKLRVLDVGGCSKLDELPCMEALVSLEDLWAAGCVKLKSVQGLEQATKLRTLDVGGCSELDELPSMEALVSLEELQAWGCVKLKSVRGLEQATKLRRLNVTGCSELDELSSREALVSLEENGYVKLKSVRGLEQATKLRQLGVDECSELDELPLEELWAWGCVKLKSLRGLYHATKLRRLIVTGCSELDELPNMEALASLEELWAVGCVKLKSIRGLVKCTQLRTLNVRGCGELEEVEDVEHCTWLEQFAGNGCHKLQCPVWE